MHRGGGLGRKGNLHQSFFLFLIFGRGGGDLSIAEFRYDFFFECDDAVCQRVDGIKKLGDEIALQHGGISCLHHGGTGNGSCVCCCVLLSPCKVRRNEL